MEIFSISPLFMHNFAYSTIPKGEADTLIVGFSLVAVCQMRDGAIHPAFFWESRTSGIFLFDKTKRR